MPVVFVHGVNTRQNSEYYTAEKERYILFNEYLSNLVEKQAPLKIYTPYWGKYGAEPKWNLASLPSVATDAEESFGKTDDELVTKLTEQALELTIEPDTVLPQMARQSLVETVDLLFTQAIEEVEEDDLPALVTLAHKISQYVQYNPNPSWLDQAKDNEKFYQLLQEAVENWQPSDKQELGNEDTKIVIEETFGSVRKIWDSVEWACEELQERVSDIKGNLLSKVRTTAHQRFTRFLGDAFKYVQYRGVKEQPGAIIREVVNALEEAQQTQSTTDPLILIAHSMGGNICYDILSYYRPDIQIDVFITVGSQVSLLRELELFQKKEMNIPGTGGTKVPKLKNVSRWLNVYNTNDFLSFTCEQVFEGVIDYKYNSGLLINPMTPHSAYFSQISFYERLDYRLRRLLA